MDRSDIRRLQKAARSNNKLALAEWASRFESQISEKLRMKKLIMTNYKIL